jgi:TNF receptor-associated factor 5
VKKFEKELKQFTQMFGRNGTFLSNVQVRAGKTMAQGWKC